MILDIDSKLTGVLLFVIAASCAILFCAPASAQSRDQVRGDLEATERILERAEEGVKETGSLIGQGSLEHARELLARAWEAYRGGTHDQTRKLTLAAREQALKAIGAVQVSDYNVSTVRRQIDQTDEILRRARDKIGASINQTAISLLEIALGIQVEAHGFLRGNRLKIALKATLKARETVNRALDIAGSSLTVEKELRRTDELIDRARSRALELGSNGSVRDAIEGARSTQLKAREEYESGNLKAARTRTMKARDLSRKALKLMERDFQPQRIERFLDQTDRIISELGERLSESPHAGAGRLLDVAIQHQKRAREAYSTGGMETVMVEAKAARELADEARSLFGD